MKAIWLAFRARRALGLNQFGRPARPAALPDPTWFPDAPILTTTIEGQLVYEITPGTYQRTLIYLHGGGYVQPISKFHWLLLSKIFRAGGTRIVVPRYGLSPRHNVDDALRLMHEVAELYLDGPTLLAGDSAGGGLALALAQKSSWAQRLKGLLLISPWVASDFSHPDIQIYNQRDPWLTPDALQYIAIAWSAVGDYRRVEVSPLEGKMNELPKTLMFIGDHDLFFSDVTELASRMTTAKVPLSFESRPGALHVYPLLPTPEGAAAREKILGWIGEN